MDAPIPFPSIFSPMARKNQVENWLFKCATSDVFSLSPTLPRRLFAFAPTKGNLPLVEINNNLIKVNDRVDATRRSLTTEGNKSWWGEGIAILHPEFVQVFPDSSYRTAAIIILRLSVILWDLEIQPEIPLSSCGMIPDLFTGVSCNRYYAPCRRYSLPSLVFPPSIHFLPWHREFGGKYWSRSNAVGIEIWPIETRDFAISFDSPPPLPSSSSFEIKSKGKLGIFFVCLWTEGKFEETSVYFEWKY